MPQRPPANEGLRDRLHADRRKQPGLRPDRFQRVLKRQAVDDRREHAHVVGRGLDDAGVLRLELGTAENVSAADHDGELAAELLRLVNLPGESSSVVTCLESGLF